MANKQDLSEEVLIPGGLPVVGAILSDQVKSLDWRGRNAELLCTSPTETISEVLQKLVTLLPTCHPPSGDRRGGTCMVGHLWAGDT